MKYSIIFLEYDPERKLVDMTTRSLKSIIINSEGEDFELLHIRDGGSYIEASNRGLKLAKGDYIISVSNDVVIMDRDWLKKYTVDGLSGFRFTPFHITGEMRPDFAVWGIDRKSFERVGLMDEAYSKGCGYEDDDYIFMAKKAGVPLVNTEAKIVHLENQTFSKLFSEKRIEMMERNKLIFKTKWNLK
jgi:GT2 family glycosyltransferase